MRALLPVTALVGPLLWLQLEGLQAPTLTRRPGHSLQAGLSGTQPFLPGSHVWQQPDGWRARPQMQMPGHPVWLQQPDGLRVPPPKGLPGTQLSSPTGPHLLQQPWRAPPQMLPGPSLWQPLEGSRAPPPVGFPWAQLPSPLGARLWQQLDRCWAPPQMGLPGHLLWQQGLRVPSSAGLLGNLLPFLRGPHYWQVPDR